ncbi:TetR/AcrR family transcriptional regulator [Nocardia stercoris]|uniref:TetR family transcriptional regulator n=1 Tax=Nocardia stercoris TaxID=2483361 RepID=A0A3M2KXT0_9NOCA|nr:TetR family transcriptional regulator [Nocardia stercoris]RMI29884.1 TetR family transcriptional regulator [Nocardia stercoris]
MTSTETDGRRIRGQQRYALVLDAAVELVQRDGLPALTTRALAAAAHVSLASITYHFPTRADLVLATCTEAARRDIAATHDILDRLRTVLDPATVTPTQLADAWLHELTAPGGRIMSVFTLYLEVARQPELAAVAAAWSAGTRDALAAMLTEFGVAQPLSAAAVLGSALDGLRLPLLAHPDTAPTAQDRADLILLFSWVLGRDTAPDPRSAPK